MARKKSHPQILDSRWMQEQLWAHRRALEAAAVERRREREQAEAMRQDQVRRDAAEREYRRLAQLYHPDHGGDIEKMRRLNAWITEVRAGKGFHHGG